MYQPSEPADQRQRNRNPPQLDAAPSPMGALQRTPASTGQRFEYSAVTDGRSSGSARNLPSISGATPVFPVNSWSQSPVSWLNKPLPDAIETDVAVVPSQVAVQYREQKRIPRRGETGRAVPCIARGSWLAGTKMRMQPLPLVHIMAVEPIAQLERFRFRSRIGPGQHGVDGLPSVLQNNQRMPERGHADRVEYPPPPGAAASCRSHAQPQRATIRRLSQQRHRLRPSGRHQFVTTTLERAFPCWSYNAARTDDEPTSIASAYIQTFHFFDDRVFQHRRTCLAGPEDRQVIDSRFKAMCLEQTNPEGIKWLIVYFFNVAAM